MRGPKCCMSILRNAHVAYFCYFHVDFRKGLISHDDFKKYPMSFCLICLIILSLESMSHVDFKK